MPTYTSPTFNTSNPYIKFGITVNETVNQISNESIIRVRVSFFRTNSYQTYGTGTCYCSIDGVTYSQPVTSSQIIGIGGVYLFDKTLTIKHNQNGTKTININAWLEHSQFNAQKRGFSVTLTPIDVAPTAPTSFTITAGYGNYVGLGDELTLTWSGVIGNVTAYDIQYNRGNSGWKDWWKGYPSTARSGSMKDSFTRTDIAINGAGCAAKYRIRARNGDNVSAWKESNTLYITGGMDLKVNNAWKQGSVWINVNGTWKRAKRVWINVNGSWKYC